MSTFLTELEVKPADNGRTWILLSEFQYHIGEFPSNDIVIVPKGYETDFASIPRLMWSIFPPWGKYGKAAVVHDWMCEMKDRKSSEVHDIFLEAMGVLGVPWWKRRAMWLGVKCCGPRF